MSIRIGIGTAFVPPLAAAHFWNWIALCEEAGIDSLWPSDFLLQPNLEPLTLLAAVAARTKRLRLGTNAILVSLRDPLVLAKQFATIDYVSEGRFFPSFSLAAPWDPGWGASWLSPEKRGQKADEAIALIGELLRSDTVSFKGAHFQFEGPGVEPRPAKPLSLWVGGESEGAIRRTATLGDGWLGGLTTPAKAEDVVGRIKAALQTEGRTIEPDHYGVSLPFRLGSADDPAVVEICRRVTSRLKFENDSGLPGSFAVGSANTVVELMQRYIAAGISKFVVLPIAHDSADLIAQTKRLASEIMPAIEC